MKTKSKLNHNSIYYDKVEDGARGVRLETTTDQNNLLNGKYRYFWKDGSMHFARFLSNGIIDGESLEFEYGEETEIPMFFA